MIKILYNAPWKPPILYCQCAEKYNRQLSRCERFAADASSLQVVNRRKGAVKESYYYMRLFVA